MEFLQLNLLHVVLASIFLIIFAWLKSENKSDKSPINFVDLISENGKMNERKFLRIGTWIVSTWGFMFLIVNDNLSEWYFIGYMGTWVANALIGSAIKTKKPEQSAE